MKLPFIWLFLLPSSFSGRAQIPVEKEKIFSGRIISQKKYSDTIRVECFIAVKLFQVTFRKYVYYTLPLTTLYYIVG